MENDTAKIRKTLTSLVVMFERQMHLGYHTMNMANASLISRLRKRLDFMKDASVLAHYRFILKEKEAIQKMMPGAFSRFKKQRKDVCQLLLTAKLRSPSIIPPQRVTA
jgi:hypothetical protein